MILHSLINYFKRFKRNRSAVIGLITVIVILIIAITPNYLASYRPDVMDFESIFKIPSLKHLFGTDNFGRDVFSRMVWGTWVPLSVGFIAAVISFILGTSVGAISGYFGGRLDTILMRIVDIFLTIPVFFLVLLSIAILGKSFFLVAAIIGLSLWPSTARLVRAEFLSLKSQEFVEAAKVAGCSNFWIIFVEILPNAIYPSIVNTSLQIARAILMEASLSFLGLGDPNVISWGWMIHDALRSYRMAWWLAVFPGIAISITVIAFNLIGDGINDALNPRLKERY